MMPEDASYRGIPTLMETDRESGNAELTLYFSRRMTSYG
jgi:hypothetical protein